MATSIEKGIEKAGVKLRLELEWGRGVRIRFDGLLNLTFGAIAASIIVVF